MNEFIKKPASARSLSQRKPVYGVGVNDAWYFISQIKDGKSVKIKSYDRWKIMLARCYSESWKSKKPTYEGCTVCKEWLTFSNFEAWFDGNYIEGYEIDKDLKILNNKIYSPEACLFVPSKINSLFSDCGSSRGDCLVGVSSRRRGRYTVKISIDGKGKTIGTFGSEELAHKLYIKAKNAEIMRKCDQYPEFATLLKNRLLTITE